MSRTIQEGIREIDQGNEFKGVIAYVHFIGGQTNDNFRNDMKDREWYKLPARYLYYGKGRRGVSWDFLTEEIQSIAAPYCVHGEICEVVLSPLEGYIQNSCLDEKDVWYYAEELAMDEEEEEEEYWIVALLGDPLDVDYPYPFYIARVLDTYCDSRGQYRMQSMTPRAPSFYDEEFLTKDKLLFRLEHQASDWWVHRECILFEGRLDYEIFNSSNKERTMRVSLTQDTVHKLTQECRRILRTI